MDMGQQQAEEMDMGKQQADEMDMGQQHGEEMGMGQQQAAVGGNAGNVWKWKGTDLTVSLDKLSLTVPSIDDGISPYPVAPPKISARAEEKILIDWGFTFPVYFEIQIIKKADKHKKLFVGYSLSRRIKEQTIVGYNDGSIAVADKKRFLINGNEFATGKEGRFSEGDVIGCGFQVDEKGNKKFFFTVNGKYIDAVNLPENFLRDDLHVYPMVSIRNAGESISTNFGALDWRWTIGDMS